ncbi:hypothetical protein K438DRAFT_1815281 [Mycena galopus ATCC 62051]|nr:hypothetical protein K438DRAFT_1815281 [Mycena galopus ATCC 62051]
MLHRTARNLKPGWTTPSSRPPRGRVSSHFSVPPVSAWASMSTPRFPTLRSADAKEHRSRTRSRPSFGGASCVGYRACLQSARLTRQTARRTGRRQVETIIEARQSADVAGGAIHWTQLRQFLRSLSSRLPLFEILFLRRLSKKPPLLLPKRTQLSIPLALSSHGIPKPLKIAKTLLSQETCSQWPSLSHYYHSKHIIPTLAGQQ